MQNVVFTRARRVAPYRLGKDRGGDNLLGGRSRGVVGGRGR
ncbi:hypothetical protein [Limosilactobacillus reuteri]|nr:hypothetical protein [Limosilactobacillus reuteri]